MSEDPSTSSMMTKNKEQEEEEQRPAARRRPPSSSSSVSSSASSSASSRRQHDEGRDFLRVVAPRTGTAAGIGMLSTNSHHQQHQPKKDALVGSFSTKNKKRRTSSDSDRASGVDGVSSTPFARLNSSREDSEERSASKLKGKSNELNSPSSSSSRRSTTMPPPAEDGTSNNISIMADSQHQLPAPSPAHSTAAPFKNDDTMGISPAEAAILQRWEHERGAAGVLPSFLLHASRPNVSSADINDLHLRVLMRSNNLLNQPPALDQNQLTLVLSSRRRTNNAADPLSMYRPRGLAAGGGGSLLSGSTSLTAGGHLLDLHDNINQLPTRPLPSDFIGEGLNHLLSYSRAEAPPFSSIGYPSTLHDSRLDSHLLQVELNRLRSQREEGERQQLLLHHRLTSPQLRMLPSPSSLLHLPPRHLSPSAELSLLAGQQGFLGTSVSEHLRSALSALPPPRPLAYLPDSRQYADAILSSSLLSNQVGPPTVAAAVGNNWRSPAFSALRSQTFPMILHAALLELEQTGNVHIAAFLPDGKSFQIKSQHLFEKSVLPAFFPKMKGFASFQRQLNLYNFDRVGGAGIDRGAYQHALFVRESPSLAIEMKRTKIKGGAARGSRRQGAASASGDTAISGEEAHGAPAPDEEADNNVQEVIDSAQEKEVKEEGS